MPYSSRSPRHDQTIGKSDDPASPSLELGEDVLLHLLVHPTDAGSDDVDVEMELACIDGLLDDVNQHLSSFNETGNTCTP
jgi:hypothetical protein